MNNLRKLIPALSVMTAISMCSFAEARTYHIGNSSWAPFVTLNVANELGFWKEAGVDVKLTTFTGDGELSPALINGNIDIGLDMMGTWASKIFEGKDLVLLGEADWSHGGDKIIIKEGQDLSTLKGKHLGVYDAAASVTYFLDLYLRKNNVKLSDYNLVELDSAELAENFIDGRINLIVNYDPDANQAVTEGNGKVLATTADFEGCMPEGFAAQREVLNNIPAEDLEKIWKGWIRAVEWTLDPENHLALAGIYRKTMLEEGDTTSDAEILDLFKTVRIHNTQQLRERNINGGGLSEYLEAINKFLKLSDSEGSGIIQSQVLRTESLLKALE
jgi:NitT/TauT family transport system substrate-binding protein